MTLYGPDISNNNGSGISMAEVAREGFSFIFAKVTEGNYFQDETWPGYRDAARAAGLRLAGYHYAAKSSSPVSQVANWQETVGDLSIPVMIDFEANSGNIDDYWALVQAFNAAGHRVALSYIPEWYWSSIGSPDLSKVPGLIASNYPGGSGYASAIYNANGGDNGPGWNAYGNATPALWQFTDQASIAGYSLDANAFRGSLAQLDALLTGGDMDETDIVTNAAGQQVEVQTEWSAIDLHASKLIDAVYGDGTSAGITTGTFKPTGHPEFGGRTLIGALGALGAAHNLQGFSDPGPVTA